MDVLVMGNFFLERKAAATDAPAGRRQGVPSEAHAIAERLKDTIGAEGVYLFGSYARGEAGPDSDLDLLAIVPQSSESRYQRAVQARYAIDGIRFPSDIIVLTRAEWERELRAPCSLSSTVAREGIALHDVS